MRHDEGSANQKHVSGQRQSGGSEPVRKPHASSTSNGDLPHQHSPQNRPIRSRESAPELMNTGRGPHSAGANLDEGKMELIETFLEDVQGQTAQDSTNAAKVRRISLFGIKHSDRDPSAEVGGAESGSEVQSTGETVQSEPPPLTKQPSKPVGVSGMNKSHSSDGIKQRHTGKSSNTHGAHYGHRPPADGHSEPKGGGSRDSRDSSTNVSTSVFSVTKYDGEKVPSKGDRKQGGGSHGNRRNGMRPIPDEHLKKYFRYVENFLITLLWNSNELVGF